MHEFAPYTPVFHQFQRDIIILVPLKPRSERLHLGRIGKPHLDTCIHTSKIGHIIVQSIRDHLETEAPLRMFVETAHDPGHVDALLSRVEAHRACDRGLKSDIRSILGMELDGQPKVGNADMLQLLVRTPDERCGTVLKIGHCRAIPLVYVEIPGVSARQRGIISHLAARQQSRDRRIQISNLLGTRLRCPSTEQRQGILRLAACRWRQELRRLMCHVRIVLP